MKAGYNSPLSDDFEWRIGAILFRSILSAVVVLLLIQALIFKEAERTVLAVFAGVAAAGAAFILFSWHAAYPRLVEELRAIPIHLSSLLWAARLTYRASRIRTNRLRRLLEELEWRRQVLRLSGATPTFRQQASDMVILVLGGKESPLATLVFSDALKVMGMRVVTFEDYPEISARTYKELRKLREFKRLALVLGQGVDELALQWLARFFPIRPEQILAVIPLFVLSQSGAGLFPDAFLYEFPVEFHVGLKAYLQRAASLAKRPEDPQFEGRSSHTPPSYR